MTDFPEMPDVSHSSAPADISVNCESHVENSDTPSPDPILVELVVHLAHFPKGTTESDLAEILERGGVALDSYQIESDENTSRITVKPDSLQTAEKAFAILKEVARSGVSLEALFSQSVVDPVSSASVTALTVEALIVENLPSNFAVSQIYDKCRSFGPIHRICSQRSGEFLVQFWHLENAQKAVDHLQYSVMDGHIITVRIDYSVDSVCEAAGRSWKCTRQYKNCMIHSFPRSDTGQFLRADRPCYALALYTLRLSVEKMGADRTKSNFITSKLGDLFSPEHLTPELVSIVRNYREMTELSWRAIKKHLSDVYKTEELLQNVERDAQDLVRLLQNVVNDKKGYLALLSYRNEQAQLLLDFLQDILDSQIDVEYSSSSLWKALIRLSRKSLLHPRCLEARDIKFEGDHPIAGGGFADVWKGSIQSFEVAVKVIRVYGQSNVDSVAQEFLKEGLTWGQLKHPNLLPFYGLYMKGFDLCLLSPWMTIGNMVEYLQGNSADRWALADDIAHGVEYLHHHKIVHGDLKGENVLINPNHRACIADFGVSTLNETRLRTFTGVSSTKVFGGTLRWQAPEIIIEQKRNSFESDIYALGMVLYELFSGEIPFKGLRDVAIMYHINVGRRPERPAQLLGSQALGENAWSLISDCWRQNPSERPSAAELVTLIHSASTADCPAPQFDSQKFLNIKQSLQDYPLCPSTDDVERLLTQTSKDKVCLLALDGGSLPGISQLLILKELMAAIQSRLGIDDNEIIIRPCDIFDLIGGSSAGGLIAILLGRLGLTVDQAISVSDRIAARTLLSKHTDPSKVTAEFEQILRKTVRDFGRSKNDNEKMRDENITNTFVLALRGENLDVNKPECFRSYKTRSNSGPNCKIWEAVRATTARSGVFTDIDIEHERTFKLRYVGTMFDTNNPIEWALDEAESLFRGREIGALVSLGGGHQGVIEMPNRRGAATLKTLEAMSRDCEKVHERIVKQERRDPTIRGKYWRLSVLHGSAEVKSSDVEGSSKIKAHTTAYLRQSRVSQELDQIADALAATQAQRG